MKILGIDPGNKLSAYCVYEVDTHKVYAKGKIENQKLHLMLHGKEKDLRVRDCAVLAIEYMHSMGMPQSQDVLDTQFFAGRLVEAWTGGWLKNEPTWHPVKRRDVKLTICNNPRAKDKNIRQSLLDMFPAIGGGNVPQVGTKAKPGPLYGVSNDVWSALAIAITLSVRINKPWSVL